MSGSEDVNNYKKMYAILCGAIDDVIEPLRAIPEAYPQMCTLQAALLEAEEIFINTDTEENRDISE